MGMLLHRQGEARRSSLSQKTPPHPPPCEVEGHTDAPGTGTQENMGRSGGRKPPSKPKKP